MEERISSYKLRHSLAQLSLTCVNYEHTFGQVHESHNYDESALYNHYRFDGPSLKQTFYLLSPFFSYV